MSENLAHQTQTREPRQEIELSQICENFARELTQALSICVNVEEIVADRLLGGGRDSNFVRIELQNVDRLIQMITDFRSVQHALSGLVAPQMVRCDPLRDVMIMDDMERSLLDTDPDPEKRSRQGPSDITFF